MSQRSSALRKKRKDNEYGGETIGYACSQVDPSILLDDHGSTVSYESVVARPMVLKCSCGIIMKMMVGAKSPCGVKIENL